jgi:IclR family pca regulon transcriptional regulator
MNKDSFVNSLQRGLQILEAFAPERPRLRLHDLTVNTGMPKTTVLRILRTLLSLRYLRFDASSRAYFLGPRAMSLGYATLAGLDLREIARPYLEELSHQTQQNVNLGILDETEVVYIERITVKHLIRTDHTVGSRVNLHSTAIGRAILANLPPEHSEGIVGKIVAERTPLRQLAKTPAQFRDLLKEVRRRGYSLNNEEFIPGIRAIGAPIFDGQGTVEGAINMPVFSKTISLKQLTGKFAPMLVRVAGEISACRGFKKSLGGDLISKEREKESRPCPFARNAECNSRV